MQLLRLVFFLVLAFRSILSDFALVFSNFLFIAETSCRNLLAVAVDVDAAFSNALNMEVQLSKRWLFFQQHHGSFSLFKQLEFLFSLLKLSLLV